MNTSNLPNTRKGNKKRMGERNHCRNIPAEIVEKILLSLPVKSLVRFSCVSKSWRSMIFDPGFIRKHHNRRSPIPGGERMAISPSEIGCGYLSVFSCPLSSISDSPVKDARRINCPIEGNPFLQAFCNELWCVQVENSLFLWNPTLNTYKKLPDPSTKLAQGRHIFDSVYGLGYDSVEDDFKILKINKFPEVPELFSLRSDSWKNIQPFFPNQFVPKKIVFASGAFYWMVRIDDSPVIVSFDLSTENYGVVVQPKYPLTSISQLEVTALRGKLCVAVNYDAIPRFILWVMEDNGVEKSWIKMFDIKYKNSMPYFLQRYGSIMAMGIARFTLRPIYLYDNGWILVKVSGGLSSGISEIFMYKNEKARPKKIVDHDREISDAFFYVESLVSPAMWPTTAGPAAGMMKPSN